MTRRRHTGPDGTAVLPAKQSQEPAARRGGRSLIRLPPSPAASATWITRRDNPSIPAARLHDLRDAMNERAQDSVVTGYDALIGSLTLPDPDDRHVLAAAIVARADVIVTRNLRDFPDATLAPYNIEAQHPDRFIRRLLDLLPEGVVEAVRRKQASLVNPPVPMLELLALFERLGLVETVTELRRLMKD